MILDPFIPEKRPFWQGKRVAVTGASGLIGSYVVKLLVAWGAEVRAIFNRRDPTAYTLLAQQTFKADLSDPQQARHAVHGREIVVSCAGITGGVALATINPLDYVGPATAMVINTLHGCVLEKVPLMGYLSSTTVYPASDDAVSEEDTALGPPYVHYRGIGESKRFCEKLCRYYEEKGAIQVAKVRPSGAYGRFDNFDETTSHVVPGMIGRALKLPPGQDFEVWGNGDDLRDLVHAQDIARGLLLAIEHHDPKLDISYNLATGHVISMAELARAILDAVGSQANLRFNPSKPTALKSRKVSIKNAATRLGYHPTIALQDGLADVVAWRRGS